MRATTALCAHAMLVGVLRSPQRERGQRARPRPRTVSLTEDEVSCRGRVVRMPCCLKQVSAQADEMLDQAGRPGNCSEVAKAALPHSVSKHLHEQMTSLAERLPGQTARSMKGQQQSREPSATAIDEVQDRAAMDSEGSRTPMVWSGPDGSPANSE